MKLKSILQSLGSVWAIDPQFAQAFLPIALSFIKGNFKQFNDADATEDPGRIKTIVEGGYYVSSYGYDSPPEQAPANSVAIISMTDIITKYDQSCGDSGTLTKSDLLERSAKNPLIKGTILLQDSGGGEAYGGIQFEESIRAIKSKYNKPIVTFVDDLSASAAYMIASATDYIVANRDLARIGSIGTFLTLMDFKGYFEQQGIKILDIYADDSADKNKGYRDAVEKGVFTIIKNDLNKINDHFLSRVENNRGKSLNQERNVWGTGKVFFADEAKKVGLIDEIGTLQETVQSILNT